MSKAIGKKKDILGQEYIKMMEKEKQRIVDKANANRKSKFEPSRPSTKKKTRSILSRRRIVRPIKKVSTKRSASAKKAWITRRRNAANSVRANRDPANMTSKDREMERERLRINWTKISMKKGRRRKSRRRPKRKSRKRRKRSRRRR